MTTPPQFQTPLIDTTAKNQQLDSIYNPQTQFIQQQMDKLPQYYDAQKASMEQAKVNAFRDIGNTAQSRGMFFSGFQPHENARYLGEKYLPGLMEIDNKMDRERTGLLGQIVGLNADRGQQMLGYHDKNDDRTFDGAKMNYGTNTDWWNTQQQWGRDDITRAQDQQWDKEMVEYSAATQAKYAPRSSSGGGGSGGSDSPSQWEYTSEALGEMSNTIMGNGDLLYTNNEGKQGYLSPSSYATYKKKWMSAGLDGRIFDENFGGYANPTHKKDYGFKE